MTEGPVSTSIFVTYYDIITEAIDGLNSIQNKLHNIGAKIDGVGISASTTPVSLEKLITSDAFTNAIISGTATVGNISNNPTNATISSSNNTSGVSIGLSCSVTPNANVTSSGYISEQSVTGTAINKTSTLYINGITLTEGKTFDITVNSKKWTANYDESGNLLFT